MKSIVFGLTLAAAAALAACGSDSSMGGMGGMPATGGNPAASFAGTWVGSLSEGGGTMMGSRSMGAMMGGPMMGHATWTLSDDGTTVTGSMDMSSFGGSGRMQMTGTKSGDRWNFTMTIPAGMMSDASCSSSAVGTCLVVAGAMTGTYSGTNSCTGAFSGGSLTMVRQP